MIEAEPLYIQRFGEGAYADFCECCAPSYPYFAAFDGLHHKTPLDSDALCGKEKAVEVASDGRGPSNLMSAAIS